MAMDFEIVSTEDCGAVPNDLSGASRTEMYVKLEKDLLEQIKMCQANRIYFKSTGDVPSTNKFHQVKFCEISIIFLTKKMKEPVRKKMHLCNWGSKYPIIMRLHFFLQQRLCILQGLF